MLELPEIYGDLSLQSKIHFGVRVIKQGFYVSGWAIGTNCRKFIQIGEIYLLIRRLLRNFEQGSRLGIYTANRLDGKISGIFE
ncbi:MAG: hypothetical protein HGB19_06765 [Chlorobiales bacterium]|jgi:hypothetical protein|nr:hypothetical protein [Chlorobiales bacterium]